MQRSGAAPGRLEKTLFGQPAVFGGAAKSAGEVLRDGEEVQQMFEPLGGQDAPLICSWPAS